MIVAPIVTTRQVKRATALMLANREGEMESNTVLQNLLFPLKRLSYAS